jgi:hypothetical protein
MDGGGEGGVGEEEPEQGGHRRQPRSAPHFIERTSPPASRINTAAEANGIYRVHD